MELGKRKRLYCDVCKQVGWSERRSWKTFVCRGCGTELDVFEAKRREKLNKSAKKRTKVSRLLGHESKTERKQRRREQRRGKPNSEFIQFVKSLPCCNCGAKPPSDAHHAVHRSQGGRDEDCVPLCHYCHIGLYHSKYGSVAMFLEAEGVDLIEESRKVQKKWAEREAQPIKTIG